MVGEEGEGLMRIEFVLFVWKIEVLLLSYSFEFCGFWGIGLEWEFWCD